LLDDVIIFITNRIAMTDILSQYGPGTPIYEALKNQPAFEKWMYKGVKTASGLTNRLSSGLLIRVENGSIVDVEDGKTATHKIIGFHRNIHDVHVEILDLSTQETLIFPGELQEQKKQSFRDFCKSLFRRSFT
jgi:hypothetical protein